MRLWYGRVGLVASFVATLLVITAISTARWGVVYDKLVPDWWNLNFGFWEYCLEKCYPLNYVYNNPCLSPECGGHHLADNGTMTSPSYNVTTHKFSKTCVWIIETDRDLCLTLKFHDLHLGRETRRHPGEKLIVYDYDTMAKLYRLTTKCHPKRHSTIATPSSRLRLVFVGNYFRGRGFNISWTSEECPSENTPISNTSLSECYFVEENINYNKEEFLSNSSITISPMNNKETYHSRQEIQMLVAPPPVSYSQQKRHLPESTKIITNQTHTKSLPEKLSKEAEKTIHDFNETIVAKEEAALATLRSSTGALWLHFTNFDIECGSQHLYIYVGSGPNSQLLSGFCGKCKPGGEMGIMAQKEVTLTFWSKDGMHRNGKEFILRHASVDLEEMSDASIFINTCHSPDELPAWFTYARLVIVIATLNCLLALPLGVAAMCPKCCTKTGVLLGTVVIVSIGSAILFTGAVVTIAVHYKSWPLFIQYGALQELEYSSHVCLAGVALLCISGVLYLVQWGIVGNDDDEHIYEL